MNILTRIWHRGLTILCHCLYRNVSPKAIIDHRVIVYNKNNLYMDEDSNIDAGGVIMNTRANFIMKKWSGAAIGLLVVTGNHMSVCDMNFKQVTNKVKDELDKKHNMDKDVIVEEDVWLGSHTTLLSGVTVGRGCEVGSGSVIRCNIPPYAIVTGNPAKVVGFRFTPEEIIEHEKVLYPEEDRLPLVLLEKNYEKFFLKRLKEIKEFTRL